MMFDGPILTDQDLDSLSSYSYSSKDYSIIARYILIHYWNWAVTLFPLWMAPNLITLLGLCFVLANTILMIIYIPDLKTAAPPWVYILYEGHMHWTIFLTIFCF
jgi:ethanolaminephosphotransferase